MQRVSAYRAAADPVGSTFDQARAQTATHAMRQELGHVHALSSLSDLNGRLLSRR